MAIPTLGLEFRAEQMPDDKVAVIRALGVGGRVMMVGDACEHDRTDAEIL
jgi:cation transport ATPase